MFSILSTAGGHFVILAADTPDLEETLNHVRSGIEQWMFRRYVGELALNISCSDRFSGADLLKERFGNTWALLSASQEEMKLRAFSTCLQPLHELEYPEDPCTVCGLRPALKPAPGEDARCRACQDEFEIGRALPRASTLAWSEGASHGASMLLFGGLRLHVLDRLPSDLREYLSVVQLYGAAAGVNDAGCAVRFIANYVPRLDAGEERKPVYEKFLSAEGKESGPGNLKTFEHLALDSLEETPGGFRGEPLLGIIKADVDRLGEIFHSFDDKSLGRFASLSPALWISSSAAICPTCLPAGFAAPIPCTPVVMICC